MRLLTTIPVFFLLLLSCDPKKSVVQPDPVPEGRQQPIPWPSLADSPWPIANHDAQATGRSPHPSIVNGSVQWYLPSRRATSSVVIGADGTLYYQADDSALIYSLYAVGTDGLVKWKAAMNDSMDNTGNWKSYSRLIVASDGTIYSNGLNGVLYAFNPDGTKKWMFMPPDRIRTAALNIGLDGTLFTNSTHYTLYAINPDGTVKWTKYEDSGFGTGEGGAQFPFSPDGQTLYVGGGGGGVQNTGTLYAIGIDGTTRWKYGPVWNSHYTSRSVDAQGNIYCSNGDTLISLKPDGTVRWKVTKGRDVAAISIDWDGNIYFCSQAPNFDWVLHSVTWKGEYRWQYLLGRYFSVHLVIDGNNVIYGGEGSDQRLLAINQDGTLRWTLDFSAPIDILACPAIGLQGKLYVPSGSTSDGALFGLFKVE